MNNNQRWRAGIVGCGKIAGLEDQKRTNGSITTHAQAYWQHPQFTLVAGVDPNAEKLAKFQNIWRVPEGYLSLEEMLHHHTLDVLSICSPGMLHYSQVIQILESPARPSVIFVEKPICFSREEFIHINQLAQQTGATVVVNHTRRFDPAHRRLVDLIYSGRLGLLVQGRGVYYGGWLNNGSHLVDTMRMFCGEEPQVVSSVILRQRRTEDPDLNVKLSVGKAEVFLESFDEAYYQLFELEYRFQFGRIRLFDFGSRIMVEQVKVNELGERVLIPADETSFPGLVSPIYHAVEAISNYLCGCDTFHRLGVDLNTVALTMELLWQAQNMALRESVAIEKERCG